MVESVNWFLPEFCLPCASCGTLSSLRLMYLDDLWQWLSGIFEAHPISGCRFSFLVTYSTFDEFSLLTGMFHNCQNFEVVFLGEKKISKNAPTPRKEKKTKNKQKKTPTRTASPHFFSVSKTALPEVCSPVVQPPCDLLTWQAGFLLRLFSPMSVCCALYFACLGLFYPTW